MTTNSEPGEAQPVMLTQQQALWLELMPFYTREAWLLDERRFGNGVVYLRYRTSA